MSERIKTPETPDFFPEISATGSDGAALPTIEVTSLVTSGDQQPLDYEQGKSAIYEQCKSQVIGICHNDTLEATPTDEDSANLPA